MLVPWAVAPGRCYCMACRFVVKAVKKEKRGASSSLPFTASVLSSWDPECGLHVGTMDFVGYS